MNTREFTRHIKGRNKGTSIYMIVSVGAGLITTFLVVWMLNLFQQGKMTQGTLIGIGVGICASQVIKAAFYALGIWKAHSAAYRSLAEIRLDIIQHMKRLPVSFFQKRKTGDLSNIIDNDVEQIEGYLAHAQPELMASLLLVGGIAVVMFLVDWRMALAMILPVPLSILYQLLCKRMWAKGMKQYADSTKQMNEDLVEYVATMPAVKAFSSEEQRTDIVKRHMKDYIQWIRKMMIAISAPLSIGQLIMETGIVLMVITGTKLLLAGSVTMPEFVLALILSNLFSASVTRYMSFHHAGIVLNTSAESICSILGEEPEKERTSAHPVQNGDIVLDGISFSYDGSDKVLKNISATFREGTVNAIIGTSGSGKSTLANLIMGFWNPQDGKITISGQSISDMSHEELSSLVSIVQQDTFLFNMSVAENIRIGNKNATMQEVMAAAKKACIHDMIQALPQGYETLVGEGGAKLSGGEKQRIAIARIILKDAPIIILDEATAAIDPYNEHLIQTAIHNLSQGKTVISIAHHLNTIVNSDQIVIMNDGEIVAVGKHEDLIDTCDEYAGMFRAQGEVDHWNIKEVQA